LRERFARHFPSGSLRHTMAASAFWSIGGAVFSRGFMLVTNILIARLLGKAGYGQWGLVYMTVGTFGLVANFGIGITIVKHVAELRGADPQRAGRILMLGLVVGFVSILCVALAVAGLAPWLAHTMYADASLVLPLMLAAIMLFCLYYGLLMLQGLAGFEDFKGIARINTVQGVVLLAAAIPLTLTLKLPGAVLAAALSQAVVLLLAGRRIAHNSRRCGMPLALRGIWRERSVLLKYALPSFIADVAGSLTYIGSQGLVARLPDGKAALGGFNASAQWRDVLLFVPESVRRITLPILSRLKGEQDGRRFQRALLANVGLNGGVALLGAIPIMALSPWILSMYGPDFRRDWPMMIVLLSAGVLQAVRDVVMQVSYSMGKVWYNSIVSALCGATVLLGSYAIVPSRGVWGYVWALLAGMVVSTALYILGTVWLLRPRRMALAQPAAALPVEGIGGAGKGR
jgi:O-antigen/teichoic acid export membrane protein